MTCRTPWLTILACCAGALLLAGCGFHLRRSAALPVAMQSRVVLQVNGGGDFQRTLAAALRANGVIVLDEAAADAATLSVPVATFSRRLLTSGGVERVGEYAVTFHVEFRVVDAGGKVIVPPQTLELSHEFAMDQTQFSSVASETGAIERSLVREMSDAVLRRLQARAKSPSAKPAVGSD